MASVLDQSESNEGEEESNEKVYIDTTLEATEGRLKRESEECIFRRLLA